MQRPEVTAVALYADRPQFMPRLLRCFRTQTYKNKWLLIYDNGRVPLDIPLERREILVRDAPHGLTIGALRNAANSLAKTEVLIHMDVDDWSAPMRFTEQVEMLQASQAAAVGANEMLFWQPDQAIPWLTVHCHCGNVYPRSGAPCSKCHEYPNGEAWRYTNTDRHYCLGTSLCYWRKTWEAKPFADTSAGEDLRFCEGIVTQACSAIREDGPRMIAEVHGGNTHHKRIDPQLSEPENMRQWHRAPEWDEQIRETMKL